MLKQNRFTIKIGGESGQGINTVGEILAKALKNVGFQIFGYREYPSLIKGGFSSYQIDFSNKTISSPSKKCDLLVCISRVSLHNYVKDVRRGGMVVHNLLDMQFSEDEKAYIKENELSINYINADEIAVINGGSKLLSNIVIVGQIWKLLDQVIGPLTDVVLERFQDKPKFIESNRICLEEGYGLDLGAKLRPISFSPKDDESCKECMIVTGNDAIGLGAIRAGVRAYYAYPMTPSSSILTFLADVYKETGMVIKQAEDEITAVQMALGSMSMGTRALTGTSGGGFDLMTESVSMAGISEIPLVCILAQRPGPATGLPTWTGAGDLNLAIYAGHGEFPRCVIAASDPVSAYLRIQEAFNIAERFQIPVIVLTEKQIAESLFEVKAFPEAVQISRGLVEEGELGSLSSNDRYMFAGNGVSKRWLPGQSEVTYLLNSDEHTMDGSSTEDAEVSKAMFEKRMKKLQTLQNELPEPELFGPDDADISFVGWGSTKNNMLDLIQYLDEYPAAKINYLHYEYIYPFKDENLMKFLEKAKRPVLIENNYTAQLGDLIRKETGYQFKEKLLKYDGRPFFFEELVEFVTK